MKPPRWVRFAFVALMAGGVFAFHDQLATGQPGFRGGAGGGNNGGNFRGGMGAAGNRGGVAGGGVNGNNFNGGVNGNNFNGGVNGNNFNGGVNGNNFNGNNFNGGGPVTEKIWICDSCHQEVARGDTPPTFSRCPKCGVKISYIRDEKGTHPVDSGSSGPFSDGSSKADPTTVKWVLLGIGGAVVVVLLIVGGIVLLVCLAGGSKPKAKRRRRIDRDYDYGY
jgi:hypothetical protein